MVGKASNLLGKLWENFLYFSLRNVPCLPFPSFWLGVLPTHFLFWFMASVAGVDDVIRITNLRLAAGSKKSYASSIRTLSSFLKATRPDLLLLDGHIDLESLEVKDFQLFCVTKQREGVGHSALSVSHASCPLAAYR